MSKHTAIRATYDEVGNIILHFPVDEEVCEAVDIPIKAEEETDHCFIGADDEKSRFSRFKFTSDAFRFLGTFTAVFLFLFLILNAQSYMQVAKALFLPQADYEERIGLQMITHPLLRKELPIPPSLPSAGSMGVLQHHLKISPSDDRLIIPKIGKNVPIVHVSDAALKRGDFSTFESDVQNALMHGVVHYPGTAEPGQVGNVFITGHSSNYPWIRSKYNAVFALLPQLVVGDEYSVFYEGELHRYRIIERREVSPKDVTVLDQPTDRLQSMLMTCVPVGTTLKRLVFISEEVDVLTGEFLVGESIFSESEIVDSWGEDLPI